MADAVCFWCQQLLVPGEQHECRVAGTPVRQGLCTHAGETRRVEECGTCGPGVRIKVLACTLHGECTVETIVGRLTCCASCEDYSARC